MEYAGRFSAFAIVSIISMRSSPVREGMFSTSFNSSANVSLPARPSCNDWITLSVNASSRSSRLYALSSASSCTARRSFFTVSSGFDGMSY